MTLVEYVPILLGLVLGLLAVVASAKLRAILAETLLHPFRSSVLTMDGDIAHVVVGEIQTPPSEGLWSVALPTVMAITLVNGVVVPMQHGWAPTSSPTAERRQLD